MKDKKIISLLLFFSIFFSLIPISNIQALSYKIEGKEYLSSLDLEGKNIHVEKYKLTKSDGSPVDSYVNWNIDNYNINGIEWITSKGTYNDELILSLDKNGIIDTEISIVAEINGQSVYKTLEIENLSNNRIRDFNIVNFSFGNALPLVEKDTNRYSVNLYLPEGVQTFKAFYKLDVTSDSFPQMDITPTEEQLKVELTGGDTSGIVARKITGKESTEFFNSGFVIEIDRNQLSSNKNSFIVKLTGETSNGISFSKTINVHLTVEGDAPENNEEKLIIELSEHYVDIPTSGTNSIPFEVINLTDENYQLYLYDNDNLRYIDSSSGISLVGRNIQVSKNAKEGLYSLVAKSTDKTLSNISSFYVRKNIVDSHNWSISLSSSIPNNSELVIPTTGVEVIELDHLVKQGSTERVKEVKYKLNKSNSGLGLKNGVLVVYPNASPGYYDVEAYLVDSPSTKAIFTIYLTKSILPTDEYRIDIEFVDGKNKFEIPSEGSLTIPIKVIKTKNSVIDNTLTHKLELKQTTDGISISNNSIVIDSTAKAGNYQVQAVLLEDLSTKSNLLYFNLVNKKTEVPSGQKTIEILADNHYIIPKSGTSVKVLEHKIKINNQEVTKEDVTWSIVNERNGVFITSEGVLNIEPTANEGNITVEAQLVSDPTIKATKSILLKKEGSTIVDKAGIKVKGFDREYSDTGEIWVTKPSGTVKRLTVHEYDSNGVEVIGNEIDLYIKENITGIKLSKGSNINEYYITLNNIVQDQIITLVAQSKADLSKKAEIKVVIKKQGNLLGILNFENTTINPNEVITASAMVSNSGSKETTAVLMLVVYDGNKMIDFKEKTITIKESKTVMEELSVRLPREVSKVSVKAFLTEGRDALTATRNISEPLEIRR